MVRLVLVATSAALTMMLFAGCGGGSGDDRAKVEAALQHYIVGLVPDDFSPLPVGAGTPRVKDNSCKDRHVKVEAGHVMWSRIVTFKMGIDVALWTCVVKLGTIAIPVNVAVDESTEVVQVVHGELLREEEPKREPSEQGGVGTGTTPQVK